MVLADPTVCPDCARPLGTARTCPTCGLDLSTPEAGRLWEALQQADAALRAAREASVRPVPAPQPVRSEPAGPSPTASPSPDPRPTSSPEVPAPAGLRTELVPHVPYPSAGAPAGQSRTVDGTRATTPRARVSAGTVLLALGALALLVSGAIFITVYWGPMGILGRAAVLLAFTAVAGVVAAVVTRRGLRASAEALWSVFLGLLTLDWFAARDQGLLGLDALALRGWVLPWAVLVVGTAVLVVRLGRRTLDGRQELLTVSAVGGLASVGAAIAVVAVVDADLGLASFWGACGALLVLLAGARALHRATAPTGTFIALGGAGAAAVAAVVLAVAQAADHPSWQELLTGDAAPLVVVVAVAAVVVGRAAVPALARTGAAGLAVGGVVLLLALPAADAAPRFGAPLVLAAASVATTWVPGGTAWARGARAVGLAPTLLVAAVLAPWVERLLLMLGTAADGPEAQEFGHRLTASDVVGTDQPSWVVLVLVAAASATVLGAGRWRALVAWRADVPGAAVAVALVGVASVVAASSPPAVLLAGFLVVGALVLWTVAGRRRAVWWWSALGVAGLAPFVVVTAPWAAVLMWPLAAAFLVVLSLRTPGGSWPRAVASGLAALWAGVSLLPICRALDAPTEAGLAALVGAALVVLLVAAHLLDDVPRRHATEVAAAVVGVVALRVTDADVDPVVAAVCALVTAVVATSLRRARHPRPDTYAAVAVVAAAVSVGWSAGAWGAACVLWAAAAAVALVAATGPVARLVRELTTGVATVLLALVVVPPTRLLVLDAGPTGLVLTTTGAVLIVLAERWRPGALARLGTEGGAAVALLVGGVVAGARVDDLPWLVASLLVAATAGVVASAVVADRSLLRLVGGVLALVAVTVSVDAWETAVVAWPVAALVLWSCVALEARSPWRDLASGAAAVVTVACALPVLQLSDASPRLATLAVTALAVALGTAASVVLDDARGRRGIEVAALGWAVGGLLWGGTTTSTGWTALLLTVLGVALVLVSLVAAGRRAARWASFPPLGLAYVLRLVASDVGVVEAYTVPFALLLLAAGAWSMVRGASHGRSVVALGPGLLLGLAPSLPQALVAPASLRGVLLGVVGLVVLAVGVRWRWRAPFVAGAVVVALLLLVQLGPVAIALPRWIVIAVAGVSMLGVGMTWESRVRDGHVAARWIGAMR